jgi:hypothetical protein
VSRLRLVIVWSVTLVAALGLARLSRASWAPHADENGVLRLALTARPERIESCRRLSDAELAERPAHMRVAVECEGTTATYRLRVWRDSTLLDDGVVRGGGFRHDRPIHLLREYQVAPGRQAVRVSLERVESVAPDTAMATADSGLSLDRATREAEEQQRGRQEALPSRIVLEQSLDLGARQVALVTWDPVQRSLVLRNR